MFSQSSLEVIGIALSPSKSIVIISIKFNDQKVTLEAANDPVTRTFLQNTIFCAYASRSATSPLLKYAVRNGGQRGNRDAGVKSGGLG